MTKFQEWTTAQQVADGAHSEVLSNIIATLLVVEKPREVRDRVMPPQNRPFVIHSCQNGQLTKEPIPNLLPENSKDSRKNRPLVIPSWQADAAEPSPAQPMADEKPTKKKTKHASESDLRKAIKLYIDSMNTDSPLTQRQAASAVGISSNALSRGRGQGMLEESLQAVTKISPKIPTPTGVRRQAVENATVFDELR